MDGLIIGENMELLEDIDIAGHQHASLVRWLGVNIREDGEKGNMGREIRAPFQITG